MDNPLDRYATPEMAAVWSNAERHTLQRKIWNTVLHHQIQAGLTFGLEPDRLEAAANAYDILVEVHPTIAREIAHREEQTGHDIKAAIDAYNHAAQVWLLPSFTPPAMIHHGLTSHDVADNVTQAQIRQAARVAYDSADELYHRIIDRAVAVEGVRVAGRTHNRPAQAIDLEQRFTAWAIELHSWIGDLAAALDRYELRGLKGAVGDSQDLLRLLGGSRPVVVAIERDLAVQFGFTTPSGEALVVAHGTTGQVYPRSQDLPIATALLALTTPCTSLAVTTRLMAGHDQAWEQPTAQQTGSTAMAHKTNPILAERIHSLAIAARGYHAMIVETAGSQWYEGDISTSAVRRIAWPGLTAVVDAALRTTLELVDRLKINRELLTEELDDYAPQLATGAILHALVKAGMSREAAHDLIRRYAHDGKTWRHMADDEQCPLSRPELGQIIDDYREGKA